MKRVRWSFNGKGKSKTVYIGDFLVIVKSNRIHFAPEIGKRWYLYIIKEDFRDERLKVRLR